MKTKLLIASCLLFITFFANVFGQTDSLMNVAKELIKQDKYTEAEKIYKNLLTKDGTNNDARFALGLLYSWSKKYDDARQVFSNVLIARPTSKEVYVAMINNELWAEKYNSALSFADSSLMKFPADKDLLIRKAKALNQLERGEEAKIVLHSCVDIDKNNIEATNLLNSINYSSSLNNIGISYTFDYFNNTDPWHWAYIQYKRKTKLGAIIGRVNYANRFGLNGYQVEMDFYPKLTKNSYAYINFGYSPGPLYPVFRLGADYNRKFQRAFEASVGLRYLDFGSSNVIIYTGHIGKYLGNYWFSLRPYVVPGNSNVSVSGIFQARRYFDTAENYLGFQLGYGTSPDDRYRLLAGQNDLRLSGYNTKLTYNHLFNQKWILNISGAYAYEEYFTTLFRSKVTFDIAINYIF
jgi:YaiO family outer membrane protein